MVVDERRVAPPPYRYINAAKIRVVNNTEGSNDVHTAVSFLYKSLTLGSFGVLGTCEAWEMRGFFEF